MSEKGQLLVGDGRSVDCVVLDSPIDGRHWRNHTKAPGIRRNPGNDFLSLDFASPPPKLAERLETPACRLLRILFYQPQGKQVCRVLVLPSPVPIYAKEDKQSKFYIRTASGTRAMDLQETVTFIKTKWG